LRPLRFTPLAAAGADGGCQRVEELLIRAEKEVNGVKGRRRKREEEKRRRIMLAVGLSDNWQASVTFLE
jgi:hypothetical protein